MEKRTTDRGEQFCCELCGEWFLPELHPRAYSGSDERGEFAVPGPAELERVERMFRSERYSPGYRPGDTKVGDHVLAHAQCGMDAKLPLA